MAQYGQSILVIDGLSETTEVLKAVFEPRGHSVNRVRQTQLSEPRAAQPSVVVWHASDADDRSRQCRFDSVPQIVIGKACVTDSPQTRRLSQPFQYRELLQAVESALQTSSRNLTHDRARLE